MEVRSIQREMTKPMLNKKTINKSTKTLKSKLGEDK